MRKEYVLIVPMVSIKSKNTVPIEFKYDNKTGQINCIKALEGINLTMFTKIYFVLLYEHELKYHVAEKITVARKFNKDLMNIEIIFKFLDYPTSSQAETIYNTIKEYNIDCPIFIKDADNTCTCKDPIIGNYVLVYPLENTPIVDPQHKSYVSIDDQNFVVNIIEKKIVSNLFNCGGYSFSDSQLFVKAYEALLKYEDIVNHMYLSHIIYWLILNKNIKFRPIEAIYYEDFEINNNINE
jgi:hypothetical protein